MSTVRIALANLRFPATPAESVAKAELAILEAGRKGAAVVCFPECYVPGYRGPGKSVPPPDEKFLKHARTMIGAAARKAGVAVVLGSERLVEDKPVATAVVFGPDGAELGRQDKVQLDPSEDTLYSAGSERAVFESAGVKFGVVICHEGWRYPETTRWAAMRGAQVVFHQQFHEAEPGSYRPKVFGDPANSFHEKAMLCRAAENTIYFASVNYASDGSPTTSAIARPDGSLLAHQPYGKEGLLVAELDLAAATGLLASRCKYAASGA